MKYMLLFLCTHLTVGGVQVLAAGEGDLSDLIKDDDFLAIFERRVEFLEAVDDISEGASITDRNMMRFMKAFLSDLPVAVTDNPDGLKSKSLLKLIQKFSEEEGNYVDVIPQSYYERKTGYCALILTMFDKDGTGTVFWLIVRKYDGYWSIVRSKWALSWD
ncbi:hypothetical protein [Rubellicoccus peritrichatus]|uniref:Uncharacterized protein n=1 Tax=Rubellicoccus peritrichatus TaxID=3080537 RepID=A0AAQ3LDI7_9BACT|nr:hypothetical protein [Puniceicoccus sp. CR14]WOO43392.1 hypothetical protein RZN69_09855 [Puniceicoccus sp. CR14]